jgi:hypothetical protein
MRITIVTAIGGLVLTGAAHAAVYGGKPRELPSTFAARLAATCQSPSLVLSAAARTACATASFPRVNAAATAFVNIGTGAELNTLMRQLPATVAVK